MKLIQVSQNTESPFFFFEIPGHAHKFQWQVSGGEKILANGEN